MLQEITKTFGFWQSQTQYISFFLVTLCRQCDSAAPYMLCWEVQRGMHRLHRRHYHYFSFHQKELRSNLERKGKIPKGGLAGRRLAGDKAVIQYTLLQKHNHTYFANVYVLKIHMFSIYIPIKNNKKPGQYLQHDCWTKAYFS